MGPPALRSIRVLLDDGYGYGNKSRRPEFFAVKPLQDGRYLEDNCVGLNVPVTDPFVAEFRRAVAPRRAASISVKAQWHGYVAVSGTAVQLRGSGGTFQEASTTTVGRSRPCRPANTKSLPRVQTSTRVRLWRKRRFCRRPALTSAS